ncbi:hypothetical protein ACLB2K_054219 [Fragaria x ananassa]
MYKLADDFDFNLNVESESQDWINKLPCCVLSSILSLLTIKEAVDTCLVSHRWRNLWKHTILTRPNLELDIANIFGPVYAPFAERRLIYHWLAPMSGEFDRKCYIKRVNEVLELYSGNKLTSFKVAFFLDQKDTEVLDKWVRFAITKGAQKLDLRCYGTLSACDKYVFPHWILTDLNVSTLKHLSLYQCVLKPPTDFDRFVQLTTLSLCDVEVDQDFLEHLFSACFLLESLTLISCAMHSNLIIGPSLHLHDLKVLVCSVFGRIEIDAVNLSSLEYDGYNTQISFMKTPKLVTIFFKGLQGPLPNVLTQLTSCPELSTLHLQIREYFEHIPQTFLTLRNLKKLKLDLLLDDLELGSVLNILRTAPLLEELLMMGFQGMWFEIEFTICILKIATKLKSMVIDPHGSFYDGDETWYNITCSYEEGNEDEHPEEVIEGISKDDNVDDNVPYELFCWQKRGRAAVQERLKDVKTAAQVIIL